MEAMTPPVDCIGLALDLEQQATLATSQTVERAMLAAAIGLRRIDAHLAQPAQAVDVGVRPICQNSAEPADLLTNTSKLVGEVAAAWRLRIGNSDVWSFCTEEWQADFYGKQSGLPYEKEPLYTRALSVQKAGPVGDGLEALRALDAASFIDGISQHDKGQPSRDADADPFAPKRASMTINGEVVWGRYVWQMLEDGGENWVWERDRT